jgi:hypothetical protein
MYYSYVEIEYVATSFSPARTDLALKLLRKPLTWTARGNTLWADAIAKKMKEVCIAFNILPDVHSAPIGYQKIPCHLIFDVKLEDFR